MVIVLHPAFGMLFISTYEEASRLCDDVGQDYDLNSMGTLKSKACIVHLTEA